MTIRLSQVCFLLPLLAGCDLFAAPQQPTDTTLWPLQLAIEGELTTSASTVSAEPDPGRPAGQSSVTMIDESGGLIPIAVLSVVDSSALTLNAEGSNVDQPLDSDALRRERLVHQSISSALVTNALIEVIQPEQASLDKARSEIIAVNSAALSAPLAEELGQHLGAEILICALIDRGGAEVNIVAQRARDGKLVYHDTIKDWDVVAGPLTEEE